MDAPRDDLTRSVPFHLERADEDGDGLTLEGYGAVFDVPTLIDSQREGYFEEVIQRGAFARSINAKTPVIQFDHGNHPLIGSIPIGVIEELREDDHGLYVRARLHDNWLIQPVRDAIRDGSVTGMSFRFEVINQTRVERGGDLPFLRTITELKLYEVGPVVFPAYESTSVGVRSREIAAALTDPEARADLARALILGTPAPEPAAGSTSDDGPASRTDPLPEHSGMSPEARALLLPPLLLPIGDLP